MSSFQEVYYLFIIDVPGLVHLHAFNNNGIVDTRMACYLQRLDRSVADDVAFSFIMMELRMAHFDNKKILFGCSFGV